MALTSLSLRLGITFQQVFYQRIEVGRRPSVMRRVDLLLPPVVVRHPPVPNTARASDVRGGNHTWLVKRHPIHAHARLAAFGWPEVEAGTTAAGNDRNLVGSLRGDLLAIEGRR